MRQQITHKKSIFFFNLYTNNDGYDCGHTEIRKYFGILKKKKKMRKIAHPICVCFVLLFYWHGMQVPLLLCISFRLGAKKIEYTRALFTIRNMTNGAFSFALIWQYVYCICLSHGLNISRLNGAERRYTT